MYSIVTPVTLFLASSPLHYCNLWLIYNVRHALVFDAPHVLTVLYQMDLHRV